MKKVLHLRSSFDPGGTEMLLMNLFNYAQQYFEIHLVLMRHGSLASHLRPGNGNRVYQWYRQRFFDLGVFKKLLKLVKEEEITIIHTHQFIELCYAVGLKVLSPGRLKLIHQIHVMFSKRNVAFYLERLVSQQFATILTVSQAAKTELVNSFGFNAGKISLLYNAVLFSEADVLRPRSEKELKVPIQKGMLNIVMIANFVWGKDHETLFKAYDSFIRERLPHINFYFIGAESDISEKLKQKYITDEDLDHGRIVFTGPVPNARDFLPFFDLVIMSCFSETFNLALVEAAAMGKVVLASDIPAFRELSENGRYFHHFKTGDAADLFESLDYLVKNLPEVSKANHAPYYQTKFGFDTFLRSLNEIYTTGKSIA